MKLHTREMTKEYAIEILNWKYLPPYDIYNLDFNDEAILDFLVHSYMAILNQDNQLIGFYCTGTSAQVPKGYEYNVYEEDYVDIGVGLKPDLTGQGFGKEFMLYVLSEIGKDKLRLTVAAFNERAIRLYKRFGFQEVAKFSNTKNDFIVMIKA